MLLEKGLNEKPYCNVVYFWPLIQTCLSWGVALTLVKLHHVAQSRKIAFYRKCSFSFFASHLSSAFLYLCFLVLFSCFVLFFSVLWVLVFFYLESFKQWFLNFSVLLTGTTECLTLKYFRGSSTVFLCLSAWQLLLICSWFFSACWYYFSFLLLMKLLGEKSFNFLVES